MKKLFAFLLAIACCCSVNLHAQQDLAVFRGAAARHGEVANGHIYWQEPLFHEGSLEFDGRHYQNLMLNVDAERQHLLIRADGTVSVSLPPDRQYLLDDYTRFPSVSETIVEYVTDVSVKDDVIAVRCDGSVHPGESLVLLDGVPYSDHKGILALNPRLLKSVEIYNHEIIVGSRSFKGAVNFISFKGRLPKDMPQPGMTRIKFDGESIPFAESNPDGFTLFWHPLLVLGPGQELSVRIPSCTGPCMIVAEGLDASGRPACSIMETR